MITTTEGMIHQLLMSRDGCKFQLVPDPEVNMAMTMNTLAAASIAIGDTYEELAERSKFAIEALEYLQLVLDSRIPE